MWSQERLYTNYSRLFDLCLPNASGIHTHALLGGKERDGGAHFDGSGSLCFSARASEDSPGCESALEEERAAMREESWDLHSVRLFVSCQSVSGLVFHAFTRRGIGFVGMECMGGWRMGDGLNGGMTVCIYGPRGVRLYIQR